MTASPGETLVVVGTWAVITASTWPLSLSHYRQHADLHEHFDEASRDGRGFFFTAISRDAEAWPSLVISQDFSPSGEGSAPGVLIVPETEVVLIGTGTRLLCYRHGPSGWEKRWEDWTDAFWGWRRHGDVVVMSAELELAAWRIDGSKLWTTGVEPVWSYQVANGAVRLDVMGKLSSFPLEAGPRR